MKKNMDLLFVQPTDLVDRLLLTKRFVPEIFSSVTFVSNLEEALSVLMDRAKTVPNFALIDESLAGKYGLEPLSKLPLLQYAVLANSETTTSNSPIDAFRGGVSKTVLIKENLPMLSSWLSRNFENSDQYQENIRRLYRSQLQRLIINKAISFFEGIKENGLKDFGIIENANGLKNIKLYRNSMKGAQSVVLTYSRPELKSEVIFFVSQIASAYGVIPRIPEISIPHDVRNALIEGKENGGGRFSFYDRNKYENNPNRHRDRNIEVCFTKGVRGGKLKISIPYHKDEMQFLVEQEIIKWAPVIGFPIPERRRDKTQEEIVKGFVVDAADKGFNLYSTSESLKKRNNVKNNYDYIKITFYKLDDTGKVAESYSKERIFYNGDERVAIYSTLDNECKQLNMLTTVFEVTSQNSRFKNEEYLIKNDLTNFKYDSILNYVRNEMLEAVLRCKSEGKDRYKTLEKTNSRSDLSIQIMFLDDSGGRNEKWVSYHLPKLKNAAFSLIDKLFKNNKIEPTAQERKKDRFRACGDLQSHVSTESAKPNEIKLG